MADRENNAKVRDYRVMVSLLIVIAGGLVSFLFIGPGAGLVYVGGILAGIGMERYRVQDERDG